MEKNCRNNIKNYIERTWMNKAFAIMLFIVGICSTIVTSDITALVFISMIALPLFFSSNNWVRI